METEQTALAASLREKFELDIPDSFSGEEIKLRLERRLAQLLERNPEEFFQLLYRIDIPETQLQLVLQQENALAALAGMVYNRQLDKVKTRLFYKSQSNPKTVDGDLEW